MGSTSNNSGRRVAFIIVQMIHKAPWAQENSVERLKRIEVMAGTMGGFGPCIFWDRKAAEEALEAVKRDRAGRASSFTVHRGLQHCAHHLSSKILDQLYEIREISWTDRTDERGSRSVV